MMELISKYLATIAGSAVKFIFGPITGVSSGLNFLETYCCTVAGMMLTVVVLSYLGTPARNWLAQKLASKKKKKVFTKRNRRIVRVWGVYGMKGVAFLTPLLLTPPGGTLIAISFGEDKQKIVLYMLISAAVWGAVITGMVYVLGIQVVKVYLMGG